MENEKASMVRQKIVASFSDLNIMLLRQNDDNLLVGWVVEEKGRQFLACKE